MAPAPLADISQLGRWSDWSLSRWERVFALQFRLPSLPNIESPARALLCDLQLVVDGITIDRPGSVAVLADATLPFRGIFASDIHVAHRWDTLEREVTRDFGGRAPIQALDDAGHEAVMSAFWSLESFAGTFQNPNRNLQRLIEIANDEARERGLDGVFLIGDLVDFKYHRDPLLGEQAVEWSLFVRLLAEGDGRLRVPCFTSTGNHDYRLYPYKFQLYGMQHCGIDDVFTREYLKRSQRAVRSTISISDLGSIAVQRGRSHSLDYYYSHVNPMDDHAVNVGGARVVFLDTGPDVLCNPAEVFSGRWSRFFQSVTSFESPSSAGLSNEQIRFLSDALPGADDTPAVICSHAPPLNPPNKLRDAFVDPELLVNHADKTSDYAFETTLTEARLDAGVFFKNHRPFFRELQRYEGPVGVISGHNHWRMHGLLRKRQEAQDFITIAQLPSLGHVKRQDLEHGTPGFAYVTASRGGVSIDLRDLPTEAFSHWLYEFAEKRVTPLMVTVSIKCAPRSQRPSLVQHRIIAVGNRSLAPSFHIEASDSVRWIHGRDYFVLLSGLDDFSFTMHNVRRRHRFTLLFESFDGSAATSRSMGLRRHPRPIGGTR